MVMGDGDGDGDSDGDRDGDGDQRINCVGRALDSQRKFEKRG